MNPFGNKGELEKMRLRAFKDAKCQQAAPDLDLNLMVNPDTFNIQNGIKLADKNVAGNSGSNPAYAGHDSRRIDFEFLLDRSGAIPGAPPHEKGIRPELSKLEMMLKGFDGDTHQTYYLNLSWGDYTMYCKLDSLQVTYKLFKPDGTPLRATVRCGFSEFQEDSLRVAEENKMSPDVSHSRTAPEGEHLPFQTFKIYGDSKYYLEVARANGIVNFRRLKTGSTLQFPPLEK